MMKMSGFTAAIIYVLRLEQRKFYVGKTDLPVQRRFLEHRRGRGAEWTRRFPPIAIDLEIRETSPYCEDKTVKQYMGMFGIENVRGGSYLVFQSGVGRRANRGIATGNSARQ
jgi:hypothetical protein